MIRKQSWSHVGWRWTCRCTLTFKLVYLSAKGIWIYCPLNPSTFSTATVCQALRCLTAGLLNAVYILCDLFFFFSKSKFTTAGFWFLTPYCSFIVSNWSCNRSVNNSKFDECWLHWTLGCRTLQSTADLFYYTKFVKGQKVDCPCRSINTLVQQSFGLCLRFITFLLPEKPAGRDYQMQCCYNGLKDICF